MGKFPGYLTASDVWRYGVAAVVFVQIWQAVAMPTVIFIAGLQQIPEEQYESAKIDGATAFQRFRYVTFPYLLPTVTVNLILTIKQGFTSFDFPYALTGGGPVRATEVIGILIYNDAFKICDFHGKCRSMYIICDCCDILTYAVETDK